MAKYNATKTLKKATPTVRTDDGVVKSWEIEVIYSYGDFSRAYPHDEDVEYLNKTPEQFTKAELVALMPPNMDNVFDSHYDTHNTPPTQERVTDFNLNNLA
jgi:hypothetical protein